MRIPDSNRLGAEGDGWGVAITTLMNERLSIGAGGTGGRFRDLMRLARELRRNGKPAIQDSAVRQKLADIYIRSKGIQYTGYRALSALSRGDTPRTRGLDRQGGGCAPAPGDRGLRRRAPGSDGRSALDQAAAPQEASWQESYLSAPGMRIAGGTDEILKNIIAERVLQLPPEIRVDKDKPFRDIPTGPPGR